MKNMKYSLSDISIVPAAVSIVDSRSQCDPFDKNGMLPLFTAPMSSVVSLDNCGLFEENKIYSILPRNVDLDLRVSMATEGWCAFSLEEFIQLSQNKGFDYGSKVLIDIANGHMSKLHEAIKIAKSNYGDNITIMAGNIANPETYEILSNIGVDYVRVGIGGGSMCLTSTSVGVGFPLQSLISECYEISCRLDKPAYIVADGGITGYADIIKALASGADYVMCGSVFNKMLESAGETTCDNFWEHIDQYDEETKEAFLSGDFVFTKENYGMSTKKAQKELGSEKLKTSEGVVRFNEVEYTMSGWVENFIDYLRSSMSYTSSFTLDDFVGNVQIINISNNSFNAINK